VICVNLYFWYIYFSTLPDGFITPGIPLRLKACATEDTASQEAEIGVGFLTVAENGGMDVQYQKQNDDVIIFAGGLKIVPADIDHPQFPGATWWNGGLTLDCRLMDPFVSGDIIIQGFDETHQMVGESVTSVGPSSPPIVNATLQAPQGTVFTEVILRTTVSIRFNHWWLGGWFIDP
jgi:hypothetical protein